MTISKKDLKSKSKLNNTRPTGHATNQPILAVEDGAAAAVVGQGRSGMSTTTCSATSEDDGHHYHAYTQTSDSSSVDPAVANALRSPVFRF